MTDNQNLKNVQEKPGNDQTLSKEEIIDTVSDTESVVKQSFQALKRVKSEYLEPQLDFIIKTVAPTLNRDEVQLFILRCEKLQIDPMSGDITAYVQVSKKTGERKLTMIVARNWKRERGMANPHVKSVKLEAIYTKEETQVVRTYNANEVSAEKLKNGGEQFRTVGEVVEVIKKETVQVPEWAGGTLWGAICTIVRDDYDEPFVVSAPLKEYKGWNVWETKPATMIKKVAESQCWDMAVPEVSRVYDESESFEQGTTGTREPMSETEAATPEQIATIKTLNEKRSEPEDIDFTDMTKARASEMIKELSSKK